MNAENPRSRSKRNAYLVAASIFALGGLSIIAYGLSSGSGGELLEGMTGLGLAYLAVRESRKAAA